MRAVTSHIISKKTIAFIVIGLFFSSIAFAQNTKGDKPAAAQKSIFKIPKLKSGKKGGDRPFKGDVSGRRIRTKNESSAARAQSKPLPFARKQPKHKDDRAYKPQGGSQLRIRSRTAEASRNNVYPSNWQFKNNPSPYPKDTQHPISNRDAISRAASLGTRRQPPVRKRIITGRTASRSYVTRGRKNVYWGKFRKGERPITTDITGRPLRAKNFHSPGLGVIPAPLVYRKKKVSGDRPYKGTFLSGYATIVRPSRAWRGDLSGHAIRSRSPKNTQVAGKFFEPRKLSITAKKPRAGSPIRGSVGASSASGKISNRALRGKPPGLGAGAFERFLAQFKGKKERRGGKSISKGFNNKGNPLDGKAPGMGAKYVDRYKGFLRSAPKGFSDFGLNYSGNIKSQRPFKGGGSASGKRRDNNGRSVAVKGPGIGGRFVDKYQGNLKGQKSFSTDGYGFSGYLKSGRPLKGGGSIARNQWNNAGRPVNVKGPGIGGRFVDTYQGFLKGRKSFSTDGYGFSGDLKSRRPLKGGGSIARNQWNNAGRPVNVKGPGIGSRYVDTYQGFFKGLRPLKGGGSIARNQWNNSGRPITVKGPGIGSRYVDTYQGFLKGRKAFSTDGYNYQGDLKGLRPLKGGGSIARNQWNNGGRPISVKGPGIGARGVDTYRGFLIGRKYFSAEGYGYQGDLKGHKPMKGGGSVSGKLWNNKEHPIQGRAYSPASMKVSVYTGNLKAYKPLKGGGSVSGKLWNNKEQPIQGKAYSPAAMKVSEYSGDRKTKRKDYVHNPNSKEAALKKQRPDKTTYLVNNLLIKTKAKEYDRNKHSSKAALKGESAGKNSLRAIEYSSKIKVLWTKTFGDKNLHARVPMHKYVRNPNSKKAALMVLAPAKGNARVNDLQVNVKMAKPNGHGRHLHPDSKFANSLRDNVKHERTFLMNLRLKWAKLFRKNDTQPTVVKEKVPKLKYDKKERELWKDLYD